MLIGGFANLVWGEPRTTMDLDITVDVAPIGMESFLAVATMCGDPLPEDPVRFAERTRVLPVRTPEDVPVDFILATLPFEVDAIARARSVRVAGIDIRVCTPEDLVIHKVISERARDHEDIVGVLKRQGAQLDIRRLDQIVEDLASDLGEPHVAERWRAAKRSAGLR